MSAQIQAIRSYHRGFTHFTSLYVGNLNTKSWVAAVPMDQFAQMADIANEARVGIQGGAIAQRPLDASHSLRLARYLMRANVSAALHLAQADKSLAPEVLASLKVMHATLGGQPVFALQPFVVSIRVQDRNALEIARVENIEVLTIANKAKLWVIDGQHRVHAIRAFRDFLYEVQTVNHYPSVNIGTTSGHFLFGDGSTPRSDADGQAWRMVEYQFSQCDAPVCIFTTLDIAQERQLFHDLNNLGKRVDDSLAFAFDESNPINLWMKRELIPNIIGSSSKVVNKDQKNWDVDEGKFVRKDLAAVNAFLFLRKSSVKSAEPKHVAKAAVSIATRFWKEILKVPGMGEPGSKKAVILAQPVVQKGIALLVNEFGMRKARGKKAAMETEKKMAILNRVLEGIGAIDWRHGNPLWSVWLSESAQAKFAGITPYLPKDRAKARGEFATIDHNRIRFGVKHNEIAPAIANLIRYALKLPPKSRR